MYQAPVWKPIVFSEDGDRLSQGHGDDFDDSSSIRPRLGIHLGCGGRMEANPNPDTSLLSVHCEKCFKRETFPLEADTYGKLRKVAEQKYGTGKGLQVVA